MRTATSKTSANIIASNAAQGVLITGSATAGVTVAGHSSYGNGRLGTDLVGGTEDALRRYGFHAQPTSLVLTFNGASPTAMADPAPRATCSTATTKVAPARTIRRSST
jgi:hypothetical protein